MDNKEPEIRKSTLSDKEDNFYKLLDMAKKTEPAVKDLMSNLTLLTQNREIITEYLDSLQKTIEAYPDDASAMTVDQFL